MLIIVHDDDDDVDKLLFFVSNPINEIIDLN